MSRPIRKPTIKKLNVRRSEQRADREQRARVAADLHKIVDRITNAWPYIEKQAAQYARGYKASTMGEPGVSADETTIVESLALNEPRDDPGWWAEQIFKGWQILIADARRIDDLLRMLTPMSTKQWEDEFKGRRSTVEVCGLCDQPAPKVRRIDNVPYCASSCYYRVWREGRTA